MENAQELYEKTASGNLTLPPGEHRGPLTIRRPCVVDGSASTLFAAQGPVLLVQSPGVTVKNLRVEITGPLTEQGAPIAIRTDFPDTKLEAVEVNGDLQGFPGEPAPWKLPTLISLGEFAANTANSFSIELEAPGEANVINEIRDIRVEPMRLKRGMNTLYIETDSIRENTILYGELLIRSSVTRRLHVTGKSQAGVAPQQAARRLVSETVADAGPVQVDTPREAVPPLVTDSNVPFMQRGQRFSLQGMETAVVKLLMEYASAQRGLSVDGYAFLLQAGGKVAGDGDLIFFGNNAAPDQAIRYSTVNGMPLMIAELAKLPPAVEKVTVCYAVYGDQPQENFSLVQNPLVRLFAGEKELCRFRPDGLTAEKAVVAAEFYRYKGEWRINFIGAGYQGGLKQLCTGYGVNVQ